MFTTCPDALLRANSSFIISFLQPCEYILKLIHACVREKKRGIICRKQWRRFDYLVTLFFKILQKPTSYLVSCYHNFVFEQNLKNYFNTENARFPYKVSVLFPKRTRRVEKIWYILLLLWLNNELVFRYEQDQNFA